MPLSVLLLLLLTHWVSAARLEEIGDSMLAPGFAVLERPDPVALAATAGNTSLAQASHLLEVPPKNAFNKEEAKKKYENVKKAADKVTGTMKKKGLTVKVDDATKKQIDQCLQVAEGLGSIMMMVAPVAGPAAPFLFAGGTALSVVGGSTGNLVESSKEEMSLAAQVKAELHEVAEDLKLHISGVSRQVEAIDTKIDEVLAGLTVTQQMLSKATLEPYNLAFNNLHSWNDQFLQLIEQGPDDEKLLHHLDYIERQMSGVAEKMNAATWKTNLKDIVKRANCGGYAAGALWFHKYATARAQLYNIVITRLRLKGEKGLVQLENDKFIKDMNIMKSSVEDLNLKVWIQLPGEELQRYISASTEDHLWADKVARDARLSNLGDDRARSEFIKEVYEEVKNTPQKGRALAMRTELLAKIADLITPTTEIRVAKEQDRYDLVNHYWRGRNGVRSPDRGFDVWDLCLGLDSGKRQGALVLRRCGDFFPNEDKWFEFKEGHDGLIQPVGLPHGEGEWKSVEMCIDDEEHLGRYRFERKREAYQFDSFTIQERDTVGVWVSGRNCYSRQRQGIDWRIQVSGSKKSSGESVMIQFPDDVRRMVHMAAALDIWRDKRDKNTFHAGQIAARWVHTLQQAWMETKHNKLVTYAWDLPGVNICTYAVKTLEALGVAPSHMIQGQPVKAKLKQLVDVHYQQYPYTPSLQGVFYPCAEAANSFLQQFD
mmetsp:Transcript_43611/g.79474  ORF Transcript_43611/g.79474 Transcript_43611/m.79474 type:complete len:713 (+) Transcript_43611:95-2233(+)